jgi:RNA polymerase sigma factor (sigma-70 family)
MTDNSLIEKLKGKDNASFEILYKFYFPAISSFVRQNMGNTEDAEDIFQETIIVLLQKVRQPGFALKSSLKTYIFSISRNLWLKRLRDNRLISVDDFETHLVQGEPFEVELLPEKTKEEKLTSWLSEITEHCQRILKAIFFYNEPMVNLMQKMGWKNKHTAANQQYKCIQQIKKIKEKEA